MTSTVPRQIYMLWDRPEAEWPQIVRLCIPLWRDLNPGWDITLFDDATMRAELAQDYAPEVIDALAVQGRADLLRIKLLASRGGVWIDATCLPLKPLDRWFSRVEHHDFAAPGFKHFRQFGSVAPDGRGFGNWFLTSLQGGHVATRLHERLREFFDRPRFPLPYDEALQPHVARNWRDFVGPHAEALAIYPYFTLHYLTALQMERDPRTTRILGGNPFPDGVYHFVMTRMARRHGTEAALAEVLEHVRRAAIPCSKLDWRYPTPVPWDPVRAAILESAAG